MSHSMSEVCLGHYSPGLTPPSPSAGRFSFCIAPYVCAINYETTSRIQSKQCISSALTSSMVGITAPTSEARLTGPTPVPSAHLNLPVFDKFLHYS
jgi:hypothetical protein